MIDNKLLNSEMAKKGITQGELCKQIGMSSSTFIRKRKKGTLGLDEAERIIKLLDIENPEKIFFATN